MVFKKKIAPFIDWYLSLKILLQNDLVNKIEILRICSILIVVAFVEAAALTCFIPLIEYVQNADSGLNVDSNSIWWNIFSKFFMYFGYQINLPNLSILIVVLAFIRQFFNFLGNIETSKLKYKIGKVISEKSFYNIFDSKASHIKKFDTGKFVNALDHLPQAAGVVARALATLFGLGITIFAYGSVMVISAPLASIFVILVVIIVIISVERWVKVGLDISTKFIGFRQQYTSFLTERIKNWRAIKTSGAEDMEKKLSKKYFKQFYDYGMRMTINSHKYLLVVSPIMTTITLLVLYISVTYLEVKITEIAIFILILIRFIPIAQNLASQRQMIATYYPSLIHTLSIIREATKQKENTNKGKKFDIKFKEILFNKVSYRYEGSKMLALDQIVCRIPANKKTAIIGRSGAGKSTFSDLLATLISPISGHIKIDKYNLNNFSLFSLRKRISYVSQQPLIFSSSVIENITYPQKKYIRSEVIKASKAAFANDFISKLPNGYETTLEEGGNNLSGGEKQRLMLARAFYKKADIFILDEATSSVDIESELLINNAITNKLKSKQITFVIIAHRLSTIKNSDHLIVLNKGKLQTEGSPLDLKYNDNWYRKMLDEK